jgi:hypothetical protein
MNTTSVTLITTQSNNSTTAVYCDSCVTLDPVITLDNKTIAELPVEKV